MNFGAKLQKIRLFLLIIKEKLVLLQTIKHY